MEDEIVVKLFPNGGLFIVMDGHNGTASVHYVSEHLPVNILDSHFFSNGEYESALIQGFERTESDLTKFLASGPGLVSSPRGEADISDDFPKLTSGVVVCVVLIVGPEMFTAHAGDCRAVLCREGRNIQLTHDHNLGNVIERERVASLIGAQGYVKGLMITRSLGNLTCGKSGSLEKVEGQIALPAVTRRTLTDEDQFMVMASDGLYEVMSNEVVIDTVLRSMKRPSFAASKSAQELVDRAVSRGSSDNICVCLVMLDKFKISDSR